MTSPRIANLALAAGALGALGAAACCAGPRVASALGCKARWVALVFTEVAPYHLLFVTIAATALGIAHYRLYGVLPLDSVEPTPGPDLRIQKAALVLLAIGACIAVYFPFAFRL